MADDRAAPRDTYASSASHHPVQEELAGRVHFDQHSVLKRLKVLEVDEVQVDRCEKKIRREFAGDIRLLKELVEDANGLSKEELDSVRTNSKAKKTEKEMYPPLDKIFQCIEDAAARHLSSGIHRAFVPQTEYLVPDQYHTLAFPRYIPDFTLLQDRALLADDSNTVESQKRQWRHQAAFVEIRPSSKQHPGNSQNPQARPLLIEVANYARVHLSARPFSVFSVNLMIFGDKFCLCIFDRLGGLVSPVFDMWRNLDMFVRVVWNMTCVLTDEELGCDPSVSLHSNPGLSSANEAIYRIHSGDESGYQWGWCTQGPVLWTSLSLVSRGTSIWRVRALSRDGIPIGPVRIMKSSWRSSLLDSESDTYQVIETIKRYSSNAGRPLAITEWVSGGDVTVENKVNGTMETITARRLRGGFYPEGEGTIILHRMIFAQEGRPIWEYDDEGELLQAFIDVLKAHKALVEGGLLHRDISAGNVLLCMRNKPGPGGAVGFLTDFDFAQISEVHAFPQQPVATPVKPDRAYGNVPSRLNDPDMVRKKRSFIDFKRGAPMTGTWQFASRDALKALKTGNTQFQVTAKDDVESFFWVLWYALLRHLVNQNSGNSKERETIYNIFDEEFGGTTAENILQPRKAGPRYGDVMAAGEYAAAHCMSYALLQFFTSYDMHFVKYMDKEVVEAYRKTHAARPGITLLNLSEDDAALADPARWFTHDKMINDLEACLEYSRAHRMDVDM
ncbi:hypothetical protein C8Q77DRAFT_1159570 [Trametes polyzona]|nr:hypothetical protein C8Q77DRAFT_1159570 [Trametes polyzona]